MDARGKIAVTGGTGRVGRHVVELLKERGHDVVPISRSLGVDVVTGEGLAEALDGVETVIDAAFAAQPPGRPFGGGGSSPRSTVRMMEPAIGGAYNSRRRAGR
jgi:nucleoside-diphosphate-sugar epimerase